MPADSKACRIAKSFAVGHNRVASFPLFRLASGVIFGQWGGRATTTETGLFEIQANHPSEFRQARQVFPASREVVYAMFGRANPISYDRDPASRGIATNATTVPSSGPKIVGPVLDTTVELARCFLRLANLPNLALDRLSRYEATLWRQAGRILYALDALDRRKPQERRRRSRVDDWRDLPTSEDGDR
jgi:hypothetical protein